MSLRKLKDKQCKACNRDFRPLTSMQRFCSAKCSGWIRKGEIKICIVCSNEFYVPPSLIHRKVCSSECFAKSIENHAILKCKECGKEYKTYYSHIKWRGSSFCSLKCGGKFKSRNQKGKTLSQLWTLRRADRIYSEFIRNRDKWQCILCKKEFHQKRNLLHCSHFWSRGRMGTRFDPDNSIAACYSCHYFKLEKEKQGSYMELMIQRLGQEKYNQLKEKANQIVSKSDSIRQFMSFIENNNLAENKAFKDLTNGTCPETLEEKEWLLVHANNLETNVKNPNFN